MNRATGLLTKSRFLPILTFSTLISYGLISHYCKRNNINYNLMKYSRKNPSAKYLQLITFYNEMQKNGYLQTNGKIGNFDGTTVPFFAKIAHYKHLGSLLQLFQFLIFFPF